MAHAALWWFLLLPVRLARLSLTLLVGLPLLLGLAFLFVCTPLLVLCQFLSGPGWPPYSPATQWLWDSLHGWYSWTDVVQTAPLVLPLVLSDALELWALVGFLLLGSAGFALFVWTLQGVFGCQGHAAQQK